MHILKPSKIQTKFVSGLLVASIFLGIVFSIGFYLHMKNVLEEEGRDKAMLIFAHVDSIQHYVRDVLRPAMYERLPASFVIEAMSSSYISRTIMSPINDDRGGTIYRRVAIDARNPAYEANKHERELIRYFRANPEQELWQGYKTMDGEKYFLKVRSVRFEDGCMYCHGRPEDAPPELLTLYGGRGFGKEENSIAGVDFVGISVQSSVGRVQQTILTYFAFFAFGAWALIPDRLEENRNLRGAGVFFTTLIAFFLVEMGDKTQLATVALAARYDSLPTVVLGTTTGMMLANIPAVLIGEALANRINMKVMRWVAAGLFVVLGILALFATAPGM